MAGHDDDVARSEWLWQALMTLPARQRAAIVLVDIEGYSVADAAQILGVAEGTVKSRCARGRARLAVLLGHLRNPATGPAAGTESRSGGNPQAGATVPTRATDEADREERT